MTILRKTIATLITGGALIGVSNQANAITYAGSLNDTTNTTFSGTTVVKNWADMSIDLGWMHTTKWFTLHTDSAGDKLITLKDTSAAYTGTPTTAVAGTVTTTTTKSYSGLSSNMAFSIWSFSGLPPLANTMTSTGNSALATSPSATHYNLASPQTNNTMGYNQVAAPNASNNSNFLATGGVNGFIGYANSGDTFTNGNGDFVGHGSTGSDYGVDGSGHKFASLIFNAIGAGDYLIALGANCVNLTSCGNEEISRHIVQTDSILGVISDTTTLNTASSWGNANYTVSVAAVPVPGAVWLFGTAMAGFLGLRKNRKIVA
ncbi:MAG: PEP-CTERM sorting domain-containing protein [Methylococcales bacterium]|nr:PEP-CTERM sorting domain-containing protein [Methylococcales bacterium]